MELWDQRGRRVTRHRRRRGGNWIVSRARSTELAVVTTVGFLVASWALLVL